LQSQDRVKSGDELILVNKNTSKRSTFNIPLSCYTVTNTTNVSYVSNMRFSDLYSFEEGVFIQNNYKAYTYILPLTSEVYYTNNIIDWNNPYNTLLRNELTSNNMWYGDNNLVECVFNNLLTRYLTVTSELLE
jgi:hypothetical protein